MANQELEQARELEGLREQLRIAVTLAEEAPTTPMARQVWAILAEMYDRRPGSVPSDRARWCIHGTPATTACADCEKLRPGRRIVPRDLRPVSDPGVDVGVLFTLEEGPANSLELVVNSGTQANGHDGERYRLVLEEAPTPADIAWSIWDLAGRDPVWMAEEDTLHGCSLYLAAALGLGAAVITP